MTRPLNRFEFSLADILFRVTAADAVPVLVPPDEYSLFLTTIPGRPPAAVYEARVLDTACPSSDAELFWDNGIWRTRLLDSGNVGIEIFDVALQGWRIAARCSDDFSSGELLVPDSHATASTVRPLYHPQDRAVILGRICRLGGVMMHSSCVLVDGRTILLVGMSGAGKTTLGRLWRDHGGILLNDERNLLLPKHGRVAAGASPWHGEENQVDPSTGPLAAVFFLNQAPANRVRPMALPESLPRMMTAAFVPVFIPGAAARTLDACGAILEAVPSYELSFTPDVRAVDLCRSVLKT